METITRNGKKYALVPLADWRRWAAANVGGKEVRAGQKKADAPTLPPFPPADARGFRDAIACARVSIARTLIQERTAAGFTQAQLARRAKMDPATLNRIERARVTLDESTYERLRKALKSA